MSYSDPRIGADPRRLVTQAHLPVAISRRRARAGLILLAAVALVAALTGCASESTDLRDAGGDYITGTGTITEIPRDERGAQISFSGELDSGGTADSDDWLGSVVVVNFWYAACPPCRAEAPDLESLYQQFLPDGVVFIGVDVRDEAATALAFAESFGISYPSILDTRGGEVQLAFAGEIAPNAVPTTIVLDREGRVASRIIGQIPDRSVLETLIEDVVGEEG
ncbi:TlpA family protein disulfide reductase [Pseudolysinimonas sp.]|uniref:TlpA family protein disulfide reductase n=1 Tax=Pseudolysinimonas sp. TaxID=2680009 RepID=UPI003C74882A